MITLISLEMVFDYTPEVAQAVMAAVAPENMGFVDATLRGGRITFVLSGENAATLRNSADDLLACIKSAEASLGIASGAEPRDDEDDD